MGNGAAFIRELSDNIKSLFNSSADLDKCMPMCGCKVLEAQMIDEYLTEVLNKICICYSNSIGNCHYLYYGSYPKIYDSICCIEFNITSLRLYPLKINYWDLIIINKMLLALAKEVFEVEKLESIEIRSEDLI